MTENCLEQSVEFQSVEYSRRRTNQAHGTHTPPSFASSQTLYYFFFSCPSWRVDKESAPRNCGHHWPWQFGEVKSGWKVTCHAPTSLCFHSTAPSKAGLAASLHRTDGRNLQLREQNQLRTPHDTWCRGGSGARLDMPMSSVR